MNIYYSNAEMHGRGLCVPLITAGEGRSNEEMTWLVREWWRLGPEHISPVVLDIEGVADIQTHRTFVQSLLPKAQMWSYYFSGSTWPANYFGRVVPANTYDGPEYVLEILSHKWKDHPQMCLIQTRGKYLAQYGSERFGDHASDKQLVDLALHVRKQDIATDIMLWDDPAMANSGKGFVRMMMYHRNLIAEALGVK